jgi:hypothetical protein
MDTARVGTLFIHGLESFIECNEIVGVLGFREPFVDARLLTSFQTATRETPAARERLVQTDRGFDFRPIPEDELESLFAREREGFAQVRTPDEINREYLPTGQGLPARIRKIDSRTLALLVNHAHANGLVVLRLMERWLELYDGAAQPGGAMPVRQPVPGALRGLAATARYVTEFVVGSGRNCAAATVDLSCGRSPVCGGKGYFIRNYSFTSAETERLNTLSRGRNLSVTQLLCAEMASALLSAQPERNRVCLSVPTDLSAWLPPEEAVRPGNPTGSLILQVWREGNVDKQVRRAFRWTKHGVNYWLPRLIAATASQRGLFQKFAQQAALPIPRRAPFENFSCAVSSVGVIRGSLTRKYLDSLWLHTRMQTVFLCALTLNERMYVAVTAPLDIYDERDVSALADAVFGSEGALRTRALARGL